ncbi:hypothetical protein OQA88_4822 [Cercophora sp. LCS_1]
MSVNPDSVVGQGEFHDRIKRSKPPTHHGHQIGQKIGNEGVPEFHAETFPPGTAPKEHSYQPNPIKEIPGQALNDNMDPSLRSSALDMPGATSQDVYNANTFARAMEGQTGRELRGADAGKRQSERSGLEGVGASTGDNTVEGRARELGADRPGEVERGVRRMEKTGSEGGYEANKKTPMRADEIASERP